MGYLFLLTGILLIFISGPAVFKQFLASGLQQGKGLQPDVIEQEKQAWREKIEERIILLHKELNSLKTEKEKREKKEIIVDGDGSTAKTGNFFKPYLQACLDNDFMPVTPAGDAGRSRQYRQLRYGIPSKEAAIETGLITAVKKANAAANNDESGIKTDVKVSTFQEQIRQAHDSGESIESLARRFGRGKGEIELIIGLHLSKKT